MHEKMVNVIFGIVMGIIMICFISKININIFKVEAIDIALESEVIELKFVETDEEQFSVIEKDKIGTVINKVVMDTGHIYHNVWCGDKNYSYKEGKVLVYDRVVKKMYVETGVVTEGYVNLITCSDDLKPIYSVNLGASTQVGYNSYLLYNGVKFPNDGGAIGAAIKNGDYLYSVEEIFQSQQMKLVIYDLQGNKVLIDESENIKRINLNVIVFIDENNNVVFNSENNLLIIDYDNKLTTKKIPVRMAEHNQVVEHNNQIYLYSKRGVFYRLTTDYQVIELANINIDNIDDVENPYYFKDGSEEYFLINSIIPNGVYHDAVLYKFDFITSHITEVSRYDMQDHEAMAKGFSDIYIDAKFE